MKNSFFKASALTTLITFGTALAPFVAQAGRPSGPQGGDAEANFSSRSSSNSTSISQGGTSSSGGNYFGGNDTHIKAGGGVAGAPGLGLSFLASACNNSFGVSVGGGSPFVFSLGGGLQWADVAGVYLPGGATVGDYLLADNDKRVELAKDLSKDDKNKLACLVNMWEQNVALMKAKGEVDMTLATLDGLTKIRIEQMVQSGKALVIYYNHICNGSVVTLKPGEKVVPDTMAIRTERGANRNASEEGHENCANEGQKLLKEGILDQPKNYLLDANTLLENRRHAHQPPGRTAPATSSFPAP